MSLELILKKLCGSRYHSPVQLAAGGEAVVWRAEASYGPSPVAIKLFPRTSLRSYYQELRVAHRVTHENLPAVVDFGESIEGAMIVYEYCSGGTLRDILNSPILIPARQTLRVGCQIAAALASIHSAGFAHGDVKPENILLKRRTRTETWKLIDFGISLDVRTGLASWGRTPRYTAPEAQDGAKSSAADIWAFGEVLREMASHSEPGAEGEAPLQSTVLEWIGRMTQPEPGLRPDAAMISHALASAAGEALRHRYIADTEPDESLSCLIPDPRTEP